MHIHAAMWLLVFGLLLLGIFWYIRGNMDPHGTAQHPNNKECRDYRTKGFLILGIAFVLTFWLYTQEPKVHIYLAE